MTEPKVKPTETPVVKNFYTGVNLGVFKGVQNARSSATAVFGGEVSKNGTYGNLEIGVGTTRYGEINVGHEIDITKSMGLEISANAKSLTRNSASTLKSTLNQDFEGYVEFESGNMCISHSNNCVSSTAWHDGYAKAGISAMFTLKGEHGKLGLGAECGYKTNIEPNLSHELDVMHNVTFSSIPDGKGKIYGNDSSLNFKRGQSNVDPYFTPKIEGELNLNKKGNLKVNLSATHDETRFGTTYTF